MKKYDYLEYKVNISRKDIGILYMSIVELNRKVM